VISPGMSDFDMYLYSDYVGTNSGFSLLLGASTYGGGVPDYVVLPYQLSGVNPTIYPGVVNWSGSDSAFVEADHSVGREYGTDTWTTADADTLPVRSVMNLYETYLTAGRSWMLSCHVLSGRANLGLRLFSDSTVVSWRGGAITWADALGAGGDEVLYYTPTVSAWYALVVEKVDAASANQSSIYTLTAGAPPNPRRVTNLTADKVDVPNAIRLAWNHVTQDSLGGPLYGRRYVIYRNSDINLVPLATDSIGGTTDSIFYDTGYSGFLNNFYRVKVKSQ
jgi:hypothetical protein